VTTTAIQSANTLLNESIMYYEGRPVGTFAALDPTGLAAKNYEECFVRDFVISALVFLNKGEPEIVRNFLETVLRIRTQERAMTGHEIQPGVMPASFRVVTDADGNESLLADFGERAIGRVAPVDSMMWWVILLDTYVRVTGDAKLAERQDFQRAIHQILQLCLRDTFEVFPALLVPDGAFLIDRRMGVYGHPLEIQSLFYGMLQAAQNLLRPTPENGKLVKMAIKRKQALRTYVRIFYWLDLARLNEIHRFGTEEYGAGSVNMLNIYPQSIPGWVEHWLPERGGYFVGNLGPGRMDFRFFALGNLLAILFGLATGDQVDNVMALYESRWPDLIGNMPAKICYPALEGIEWELLTGSDPKNVSWSYHNGGNWPCMLWTFVAAAIKGQRHELARKAFERACAQLPGDSWPEYYDGRTGRLIGRRANLNQTWSAAALIFADQLLQDEKGLAMFPQEPGP